jgi:predicted glycosyltransferase
MRILCDAGHPAHIHLFKNALWQLEKNGHRCLVTTRDKEVTLDLLRKYDMEYVSFGSRYTNIFGKAYGMFKFDAKMLSVARRFDADVFISHGSMYAAHAASLLNRPHISTEDTGNMEQIWLYKPFTKAILTSKCFNRDLGPKQIRYDGYHELAYLRPNYYTPDPGVLRMLGIRAGERYVILRFVSWRASHDIVHPGISIENKLRVVREFSKYARVYISSETRLDNNLASFQISLAPELMHDALYYAALLYGESGTMASESAVLGTPAIFLDNVGRYYTREQQEQYGLVYNYTESLSDQEKSIKKGVELLRSAGIKKEYVEKRNIMLNEKIDVTAFLKWFIENYPSSYRTMKKDPDYQLQFKEKVK